MSRRVGSILLAIVVVGAPAALTTCEIVCTLRDGRGHADVSALHSCLGTQPPNGPGIKAGTRICGHDEELPVAASQAAPVSLPGVGEPAPSIVSFVADALPRVRFVVLWSPRHPTRPVPLRV